jgi:hypothetical protein
VFALCCETLARRRQFPLEPFAVGNHAALRRGPRAEARQVRSGGEIDVRFSGRRLAHRALDAYLAFQLDPVKKQSCRRPRRKLRAFAALVVGEKKKAAIIGAFEQHDARGRRSVRGDRCQSHRGRLGQLGLDRFVQPAPKLS